MPGGRCHQYARPPDGAGRLGGRGRFLYASRDKLCVARVPAEGWRGAGAGNAAVYEVATVSLGIQAIHQAFAAHVPLSLTPDFLWYLIVHEVAEYVRQNPGVKAGHRGP